MRKNVASQTVCAQLTALADGAPVTAGTTTVYVTGDGGAQGAGAGTVTHEGNGCWSYVPTQAETNYDHVAFTFVNASAVAVTVNVYPTGLDPTDATTGGLGNLDAAVSSRATAAQATAIEADTQDLQTRLPAALVGGRMDSDVGNLQNAVIAAATFAASAIDATALASDAVAEIADGVWDELLAGHVTPDSAGVALSAILTDTSTTLDGLITGIKSVTDNLPDSGQLLDLATLETRLTAARAALLDALSALNLTPVEGQCATGTNTTTVITTNLTGYAVNALAGRVLTVKRDASTAAGAAATILSNTAGGAEVTLEASEALPAAMTVGDDFVIS